MEGRLRWDGSSRMDDQAEGRSLILRATLDCMATMGADGFSIDDVAKRANISRRTLYRYFSAKSALIEAAIELENETFFADMRESLSAYETDLQRYLEACLVFVAQYRRRGSRLHQNYLGRSTPTDLLPHVLGSIAPMWRSVLMQPYAHYAAQHQRQAGVTLDELVAMFSRLGLAYSLLPADEAAIRSDLRVLRALMSD